MIYQLCMLCAHVSIVLGVNENYTLKSVSVAFRHGDRTPEPYPTGFYPNDPHINRTFEPMGFAGLTNVLTKDYDDYEMLYVIPWVILHSILQEGKRREHQIGVKLRERYNAFLGDTYKSSLVSVISTPSDRTKMSLLLVLAGLYPPKDKQVWNDNYNWQPIPINSVPLGLPSFLYADICPTYSNELERIKNTDQYKRDLSRFDQLMKDLTKFTGRKVDNSNAMYHLYHTLTAEQGMNLTLPDWTKPYFPNGLIINATLFEYETQSYTPELIKTNGGMFLKKLLNDIVYEKKEKSTKLFLYSVHENNIAAILHALKLWKRVIPAYGSGIIIELYEKNTKLFIRTVYYKSIPAEFEVRQIPGCDEFCALEDFIRILQDIIPDDTIEACYGPPSNSLFVPKNVNPISWIYGKIKKWFNV